jgi:hypothetical protein
MSFGVAAGGCGGSPSARVANLATTSSGTTPPAAKASTTILGDAAGSSSPESSSSGTSGKTGLAFSVAGTVQEMTKFAACMRANGEPTFPDPNAQGVISAGSLDRGSPQFRQALAACRKNMPNGTPNPAQQAQNLRQAVAASACMRRNGVPNFPDPQTGSGGAMVIRLPSNTDPSSPQFQHAQHVCQKEGHGGKG